MKIQFAVALAAFLSFVAVPVSSQEPAPSSPSETPTPLSDLIWASFPGNDAMTRYYPGKALSMNRDGKVSVTCGMLADGHLTNCQVGLETPVGYGFGEATVKMLEATATVRTKNAGEKLVPGSTVTVTINWRI